LLCGLGRLLLLLLSIIIGETEELPASPPPPAVISPATSPLQDCLLSLQPRHHRLRNVLVVVLAFLCRQQEEVAATCLLTMKNHENSNDEEGIWNPRYNKYYDARIWAPVPDLPFRGLSKFQKQLEFDWFKGDLAKMAS
jgi:hypothetical protein